MLRRGSVLVLAQVLGACAGPPEAASELTPAPSEACSPVEVQPDRGAAHLGPGEELPPAIPRPATSGPHDPRPLPPQPSVYAEPVPEAAAVHNLEHGYVLVYHRPPGPGAPSSAVVQRLATMAEAERKVIMAPYPDLPPGAAVAFLAWRRLQVCGPALNEAGAGAASQSFISSLREVTAPEPQGV